MEHDTFIHHHEHRQQITISQLLSIKRHELPPPEYFDRFLDELRQRLMSETTHKQEG